MKHKSDSPKIMGGLIQFMGLEVNIKHTRVNLWTRQIFANRKDRDFNMITLSESTLFLVCDRFVNFPFSK